METIACPAHATPGLLADTKCPLQQLADHTITMTGARAPHVACIMLLVDTRDPSHQAFGSDVDPRLALAMLEYQAARLRTFLERGELA